MRWIVLAALIVALVAACGDGGNDGEARLRVVATTTQIADLARQIAGERAEVLSLLPANADAHDFEPTPRDVERVSDADLILRHGLGLDDWIVTLIAESGSDAASVTVTEGITPLISDGKPDPHVWLDVAHAKVMVERIEEALVAADEEGAETYRANAARYQQELDELDRWIRQQIDTIPEANRGIVTTHDAIRYYVEAYGLRWVGAIIPSLDTQAQPTAQATAALVDRIRAEGVRAIFAEASLNPDLARQLASEAGVTVVDDLYIDSLGPEGSGAETYTGMMRLNTTKIVEALR